MDVILSSDKSPAGVIFKMVGLVSPGSLSLIFVVSIYSIKNIWSFNGSLVGD